MVIFGAFSAGMLLFADGVLRHAVGEGAHFAQVSRSANQAVIEQRIRDNLIGLDPSGLTEIRVTSGSHSSDTVYATISVHYRMDYAVPFIPARTVNLSAEKTVYWADYT